VSVGAPASSYGFAVVDSGGPAMFLPKPAFDAVTHALGDNSTFREQIGDPTAWFEHGTCRQIAISRDQLDDALPVLSIALDGATLEMRPSESYLSVVRWRDQMLYCPALRPAGVAAGGALDLGDSVMRSHVVVFDRAGSRMGFARPKPCDETRNETTND
jgi:hypothetical protein